MHAGEDRGNPKLFGHTGRLGAQFDTGSDMMNNAIQVKMLIITILEKYTYEQ